MRRCLELASKGRGFVAPNPLVGAVIVHNGRIIGEGYHRKYGEAHAEVNAINSVKNKELLKDSTIYVNLEPCSHYGKTPPCAKRIIEEGIPRVVIGHEDPNPKVSGRGIAMLKDNNIEVVCNVLKDEAEQLNVRFITSIVKKRPYIILKWAQSVDGFIDKYRELNDGQLPVKFSDEYTQTLVHKLRAEESAIIIGSRTALLDNPQLNVRYWHGNNPQKIIADSRKPLNSTLNDLYSEGIQSLIVEGGTKLITSFINQDLWDEARIEISHINLLQGIEAPKIRGTLTFVQKCKKSEILFYKP
ncbi:diaminohydroxyphosphoribosylaminopyrimidine deaminase/5-amino-6-(5-phosphoribosylamino)uracil reductase [Dysgonomonadaceae bacterium PH5-43]|nr:diaminohydroxyphosphoribosylaminopyrimidine deaminase/5-amino-6-(5-phosphoribosylamino)uracil reductase [Dysgonomonadaceae bacterium PH5-43]